MGIRLCHKKIEKGEEHTPPAQLLSQSSFPVPAFSERFIRSLWRNLVPPGTRLLCFCVQILLILRFVGRLISLSQEIGWVNIVYIFSDVLLIPFHAVMPPLGLPLFFSRVELYTLLAIVVYGLCARLLTSLAKVFPDAQ